MTEHQCNKNHNDSLDKAGIFFSSACAIHCLLPPFLALFAPSLTSYLENEWIHMGLLVFVIPVAFISFLQHEKIHHQKKPMIFGFSGLFFLILAVVNEHFIGFEVANIEFILTFIGCLLLVIGHVLNIKHLRKCQG